MIFINFKTYREGTGKNALNLAEICQKVSQKTSVEIVPLVQAVDLFRLSQAGFEVWAQHLDDIEYGANSGQILPEAVLAAGVKGAMLNHSECKLPVEVTGSIIEKCKHLGIKTLICAESVEEAREIESSRPDFLGYEPPELIGSRATSVSQSKPEVIKELAAKIKTVPILVGAGIHSQEDVKIALSLGAKGVLVASDVVLAKDPGKELEDLAAGFKKGEN